jgi:hypothetical protein
MALLQIEYEVIFLNVVLSQVLLHVLLFLLIEIINHVLKLIGGYRGKSQLLCKLLLLLFFERIHELIDVRNATFAPCEVISRACEYVLDCGKCAGVEPLVLTHI